MQTRLRGLSLIEVVAFLVVVGAGAALLLPMLRNVMPRSPDATDIIQATHLAQARMELILGQRAVGGYSAMSDPCIPAAGAPAICTAPAGFNFAVSGVSPVVPWPANTDTTLFKQITVQVTGPSGATLSQIDAVVANY